ncbi:unnamed protein product, partial [Ascophyllum nodosum]
MAGKSTLRKASVKAGRASSATTSNRGKTAPGSAVQPPNAVDSGLTSVGNHEGSASGQDVAARMRAIPVENNKPEMIRLVSSDGA